MCTARNLNPMTRTLSVRHKSHVGALITVSAGSTMNGTLMRREANRAYGGFHGNSRAAALVHARGKGIVRVRRGMVAPRPCGHLCRLAKAGNFTGGCPMRNCTLSTGRVDTSKMRPGISSLDSRDFLPGSRVNTLMRGCRRPVLGGCNRVTGRMNKRNNVSFVVSDHLMCYLRGNLPLSVSMCSVTR